MSFKKSEIHMSSIVWSKYSALGLETRSLGPLLFQLVLSVG